MNVLFVFCSEKLSIEFSSFLEKLVFFSYFIVKIDYADKQQIVRVFGGVRVSRA